MILGSLLELLTLANVVRHAPPLLTAVGVAYLVVMERRRGAQLRQLEVTTSKLIVGHTGDAAAHRELAVTLTEEDHAGAH